MTEIPPVDENLATTPENSADNELLGKTRRWVDERSLTSVEAIKHPKLAMKLHWERNARRQISEDIQKDIRTHSLQNPLTPESVAQRAINIGEIPKVAPFRDTLTGESFYQILRREGEDIIAEERRTNDLSSEANLISQARLDSQGQTELTLTFIGERYQARDANPNIVHSNEFPCATVKVFDTLSKSVDRALRIEKTSDKPTQNKV